LPLYEYRCEKCGKVEEMLVSGFDHEETHQRCDCGGKLKRIFSTTAETRSSTTSSPSASSCPTGICNLPSGRLG